MGKRPLCLVCLVLMGVLFLLDLAGFSQVRGNPLPKEVQEWIRTQETVTICGEVAQRTDKESSQSIYLKNTILMNGSDTISIEGVILYIKEPVNAPEGAFLVVSGTLKEIEGARNPGGFDGASYYACKKIYYRMPDAKVEAIKGEGSPFLRLIGSIRDRLGSSLKEIAGSDAPFFEAMLLGEKGDLDEEIKTRFSRAGILHILTISGLHIGLIGMALLKGLMLLGLGLVPSGFLSLFVMLFYGILTGSGVATLRAVVMFLLSVGGRLLGRSYDPPNALAVSGILLLLNCPAWLFSSSFLFSFSAVLGISVLAPALTKFVGSKNRWLNQWLTSLAVQSAMLPFLLYFNGEVSLAGLFLNLLVLPTIGAVLISGLAGAGIGLIWPMGGSIAVLPGRALLHLYEWLGELAGRIPFCTWIPGSPSLIRILVYGACMAGFLLVLQFLTKRAKGKKLPSSMYEKSGPGKAGPLLRMLASLVAMAGMALLFYPLPSGKLQITCLDVGQGDGCVVTTPEGKSLLIDCGSTSQSEVGKYTLLPYLKASGIRELEAILVSHTDEDHVNGIQELLYEIRHHLTGIQVKLLVLPDWSLENEGIEELKEAAEAAGIAVRRVSAGDRFSLGETSLEVLSPSKGALGENSNEDAMVLRLSYGDFHALFTGDIGTETEDQLLDQLEPVNFLKVAHHGSRYSSGEAFLETVLPQSGVISCSLTNRYGHPAAETVERLEEVSCSVFYTMKNGAITLRSDGEQFWISGYVDGF